MLYPLKFTPIIKKKIWGGSDLKLVLNKENASYENCGESWEISGLKGDISVVKNGFLEDNSINELIEIYMGDFLGDKVYEKFGNEFPLLIKFIDAQKDLSIQVHPDDKLAKKNHKAYGKTEMWYILEAEENANIITGFSESLDKKTFIKHLEDKTLISVLNKEIVKTGDVFFIPSGRIHNIGEGVLLTEIQQTSDITYRVYDFERKDKEGNLRDLHIDLAIDALDFKKYSEYKTDYEIKENKTSEIINSPYFTTNILSFDKKIEKDYNELDSFVIYICVEGSFIIDDKNTKTEILKGETCIIPAELKNLILIPNKKAKVLEVFIKI